jgi:DNA-binding winged helix-turn-helix (wHTH) protein
MALPTHQFFRFGRFELDAASRALTKDGRAVRLGSRAFDILVVLLSRAGEIVSKDELIAAVWPNLHVEENNLRVHLTALRRVVPTGNYVRQYCWCRPPRTGTEMIRPNRWIGRWIGASLFSDR